MQGGLCGRGEKCPYTHNVFEYWLHPVRSALLICSLARGHLIVVPHQSRSFPHEAADVLN